MVKFSKKSRTSIEVTGRGDRCVAIFTSYVGTVGYEEKMPGIHTPGWASWCAFRLLHPVQLHAFENEIRQLFEFYKSGKGNWVTYNEAKRALLQRYLQQPYDGKRK